MHPLVILFLPAAGALLAGLVCLIAPETRGGGGDAMIHAFHHQGGVVRRRVIWVKALASILTLGSGGSGGREGPTMQMGGALGSAVGLALKVSSRERRILMLAGVAAGMAAVFRTPLGAALLAAEVLYRDDFEAEALVPAVLASVISYSVVISIFGESTLFARAPRYAFIPRHLPLYALLAVLIAVVASLFLSTLRAVQRLSARLPLPGLGAPRRRRARLERDRGAPHPARGRPRRQPRTGARHPRAADTAPPRSRSRAPTGCRSDGRAPSFLLFLCGAKLLATSFTIGTGGSAGDFGPSLVLGGLFGGAFGHAASALLHDPSIDPGAFALVGMGTFYGGLAHVPVSSLVMVCELAGSYDLLVPLMLAEGIAFVALRKRSLYRGPGADPRRLAGPPRDRLPRRPGPKARRRRAGRPDAVSRLRGRTPTSPRCGRRSRKRPGRRRSRWSIRTASSWGWSARHPSGSCRRTTRCTRRHPRPTSCNLRRPRPRRRPPQGGRADPEQRIPTAARRRRRQEIAGFLEESEVTRAYLSLAIRRSEASS